VIRVKKKILLVGIVLLMILVGFNSASSKAFKFGDWSKWEETLPPWDDDSWRLKGEKDTGVSTIIDINSIPIYVSTRCRYFNKQDDSAIVLLLSKYIAPNEVTEKDVFQIGENYFLIPDFAIAIFFEEDKFICFGYEQIEKNSEKTLFFSEKWNLKLSNKEKVIFDKKTEFYKRVIDWLEDLISEKDSDLKTIVEKTFPKEKYDALLPQLIYDKRGYGFVPRKKVEEWTIK